MTDEEWQARYQITSVKGKVWSRAQIRNRAVKMAAAYLGDKHPRLVVRTAVQLVLDDPDFIRQRTGMVPARVIEDAAMEAFLNVADPTRHAATQAFLTSTKGTLS
ncbi:MAG TPA: hypothetical protein VLE97_09770 [Gaiellaceae bacterium]|nr:hypothetical protein [Gaiellaceae bacterium]